MSECKTCESLRAQLASAQAEKAAALEVKANYDRWLSKGVYFTNEEYIAERARNEAEKAELVKQLDSLEVIGHIDSSAYGCVVFGSDELPPDGRAIYMFKG